MSACVIIINGDEGGSEVRAVRSIAVRTEGSAWRTALVGEWTEETHRGGEHADTHFSVKFFKMKSYPQFGAKVVVFVVWGFRVSCV